jgi:hypothetical protein
MGIGNVHAGFLRGNLKERDHLQDLSVDGRIILLDVKRIRMVVGHGWDCCGCG